MVSSRVWGALALAALALRASAAPVMTQQHKALDAYAAQAAVAEPAAREVPPVEEAASNTGSSISVDAEVIDAAVLVSSVSSAHSEPQAAREMDLEHRQEMEEEEIEVVALKWTIVVGLVCLILTFLIAHYLESLHFDYLPEAGVAVLLGIAASAIFKMAHGGMMMADMRFDFEFFMIWLLPPIIFEAGYNMNRKAFFDNIFPTALFAFFGTVMSAFTVAGFMVYAGEAGISHPIGGLAALTFGSLISATDPVTVLAVFQALGVKVDLFSMVFGESVMNDAVAIVLSRTMLSFKYAEINAVNIALAGVLFLKVRALACGHWVVCVCVCVCADCRLSLATPDVRLPCAKIPPAYLPFYDRCHFSIRFHITSARCTSPPLRSMPSNLQIFIGSTLIGVLFGMLSSYVMKHAHMSHHEDALFKESVLVAAFAWASYYVAEAYELSGIVAILFCGIVMASYTRDNLSEQAQTLTARTFKVVALLSETFVFVYLGMAAFAFPIWDHIGWATVAVALFACFVGRTHIYLFSYITNFCFRSGPDPAMPSITTTYMHVMYFSGLRGGVAFAISAVGFQNMDFPENGDSMVVMQTTLVIALFTIFFMGGTITDLAKYTGVLERDNPTIAPKRKTLVQDSMFGKIDKLTIRPFLTHHYKGVDEKVDFEVDLNDRAAAVDIKQSWRSIPIVKSRTTSSHSLNKSPGSMLSLFGMPPPDAMPRRNLLRRVLSRLWKRATPWQQAGRRSQ
ncbi:Sodium/hydrogen exchanger family-domain-containing protein [Pavlovales sp. CCMP2436]|nr:Sodium/hydrogen exchanger family-domain-containing protein [Pavlovales sp. CCMP2436]